MIEYLFYGFIIGAATWAFAIVWGAVHYRNEYRKWFEE